MVKQLRRSRARCVEQVLSAAMPICERLENRQFFDATLVTSQGPILAHPATPASDSIDLSSVLTDPSITNSIVEFQTTLGNIDVELFPGATPLTVANFLSYVNSGAYNNTIFHRNAVLSDNSAGSPTNPADIVQGGGYIVKNNATPHIPTNAPVADEYTTRITGNNIGTLAMAKTASPNSATSEFFFNVHANNTALDTPTADTTTGVLTSYTVFGVVLNNGEDVVNALADLPTVSISGNTSVPVVGVPESKIKKEPIRASNLTYLKTVKVIPQFSFSAVSDNPSVVKPVINGNTLSFQYAPNASGVAAITLTGTSVDGTSASETFTVTVPNTAAPAATVTAVADSQTVTESIVNTLHPLKNDTDSLAALNPAKLTVITQPAHGTATPNIVTGAIVYNPTAGYTGPDSFTYTITDTAGNVSPATTFSLTVAAPSATVNIDGSTTKELVYTQPNGAVGRLKLTGGTAVVTFTSSDVQTSTKKGITTAKGTGATISSIVITNATSKNASLDITSNGTVTVGSISDTGSVASISGSHTQLTGTLNVGGLGTLLLASTQMATLTIGSGISGTSLLITNATDTSVTSAVDIKSIKSRQWLNTDGLDDTITAASLADLEITGEFADRLTLTDINATLKTASIGGNLTSGAWTVAGNVDALSAKSALASWSLTSRETVSSVQIHGDLAGSITADTIGKIKVSGAMHGNSITSTAGVPNGLQINTIAVSGAITNSKIIANGTIGSVTAASMSTSQIDAGTAGAFTNSRTIPSVLSDFTEPAMIRTVHVGGLFSDSVIAAFVIKDVKLQQIDTTSDGLGNGVAGKTIDSLSGALSTGGRVRVEKSKLKTASAALHSFSVNLVT